MRKKLLLMTLITIVICICIISFYTITSTASSIISNSTSSMSDQEKVMFNKKFEIYEGKQSGAMVKEISNVITTNNQDSSNRQVTLDSCEIDSNTSKYNVALSYDNDGYVNKVSITKDESSSNNTTTNNSLEDTNTNNALDTNTNIITDGSSDSDSQISYDDDKISFDTESDTDLPQTGKSSTTGLLLIVLSIISIIALIKYKKIK